MDVVVYGVSSPYVGDVAESLRRLDATVHGWVVNVDDGTVPSALSPLLKADEMPPEWAELGFVFAMVTPAYRQRVEAEVRRFGGSRFPAVIDPTAVVASTATIAEGVSINAAAVIGAGSVLHRFTLVNRSASVGHGVELLPYATLGPACVLCGDVRVGVGAFVGAGAVLNPGVEIGANAVVGAGAVVVRDVPPNTIVVGNPAKVSREGIAGYNGESVTGV